MINCVPVTFCRRKQVSDVSILAPSHSFNNIPRLICRAKYNREHVLKQEPSSISHPLLPESGKIIHSLKLEFGVLESGHSLLQRWTHRGWLRPNVHTEKTQLLGIYAMLTYIFITFPKNACHIHGSSENSLVYVNVFHACLLASPGGRRGSSDEGLYSSSRCPLIDLCFCANSVLRSGISCPSRLLCYSLLVTL